jgi:hypothetical protein
MVLRCWVRQLPHDGDLKPGRNGSGVGAGSRIVPERLATRRAYLRMRRLRLRSSTASFL